GQLAGTPAQVREILADAYALATPTGNVTHSSYWKAQTLLSEPGLPAFFQEKSRFFNEAIDHRVVAAVFDWLHKYPKTAVEAAFKLFQTGGAVNDRRPHDTAFVHRMSHWLGSIELYWDSTTTAATLQENLAWLRSFNDALVPLAKGGAYQNFIDPTLADWKRAYYGDNLARLEALKRRVDPTNVFKFPEAIPRV
ncbi:MAG TPA: BBE domain-containing protein, partial [Candidatus Baltobacteraceae bacterium]|nr:BBE domain-containing protein [Candidatus Baltobacteraceae bacterium]